MKPPVLPSLNAVKIKLYFPMVVLIMILIAEVYLAIFYLPSFFARLMELRAKINTATAQINGLRQAVGSIDQVDSSQLAISLARAETALPDEKRIVGVVSGLGQLASASGIVVNSVSYSPGKISTDSAAIVANAPQTGPDANGFYTIPVSLSLSSSLDQLVDYLKKLQLSGQLLGATTMRYSKTGGTPEVDLSLTVYFLPRATGDQNWDNIPTITPEDLKIIEQLPTETIFSVPAGPH